MRFWFLKLLEAISTGQYDIRDANIAVKLLTTDSTALSQRATATLLSDLTVVGEWETGGYAEYVAGAPTKNLDTTNFAVEFVVPAGAFGAAVSEDLSSATALLVYDKTSDRLLAYSEDGFPLNGDGGPLSFNPDVANGLLRLT